MFRITCLCIGYLFGIIQTAFIYGKMKGIDIREHGSGNAGTTNTLRVLGTKAGLIVFVGDCLKALAAILLCTLLFKEIQGEQYIYLIKLYAGAGAILGHNFPFYLKFKGGKGIACTAGLMFSFDIWFTVVGLIVFFSLFLITHYVSLGSLMLYPYIIVMEIVLGVFGYFANKHAVTTPILVEMIVVSFLLGCLTVFMHRANIKRLLSHSEKKTYLTKKCDQ